MTSMIFAFLCFTGIFVMFLYLIRSLEKFQEQTRNEHAKFSVRMRALEAQLDILTGAAPTQAAPPAHASLPDDPQAPLKLILEDPMDAALDAGRDDPLSRFEPRR
jgi:hypothetical protein